MANVRVTITGIDEIEKKVKETFGKVARSKQMRTEVGVFVTERLRAEARRGKPLNNTRTFPALKDITVNIRKQLEKLNQTHQVYKSDRSNVTFTGQLLSAIGFTLPDKKIVIEVESSLRAPIQRPDGKRPEIKTNKQVASDLSDLGFVLYTAKGIESEPRIIKRINNIVKKFVRRAIKVNFGS